MSMEKTIKTFLDHYKIRAPSESARSYIFDCPACGGQKKLYIQKEDGRSVCFKQGSDRCPKAGSSVPYALSLLSNLTVKQVKEFLFEGVGAITDDFNPVFDDDAPTTGAVSVSPVSGAMFPADLVLPGLPEFKEGQRYLNGRGVTDDMIMKYGIGYSPGMRRVIFPVFMKGELYGWQGRAIDPVDKEYRMYNLPGPWKANTLMFYDNIANKDFAILAEGAVSALKFYNVGNFVASMGKEVSKSQLELIVKAGIKKLFLALDRDAFAKNEEIRYTLSNRDIQCFLVPVPGHRDDFGDATLDECSQAFNNAKLLDDALVSGTWDTTFETSKKEKYVTNRKR